MGNFDLLAAEGLVRSFREGPPAVDEAVRLMADPAAGPAWRSRAAAFGARQRDTTAVICEQLLEVGGVGRLGGFSEGMAPNV